MLAVTNAVIEELGLVARALGLLSESVASERARGALLFSVEALGRIEQQVIDLEFSLRSKAIELEACHAEVARLREMAMLDQQFVPSLRGTSNTA